MTVQITLDNPVLTCVVCGSKTDLRDYLTPAQLKEGLYAYSYGKYVQTAFPTLSSGVRELLISQTCEPCFDSLFRDDEK